MPRVLVVAALFPPIRGAQSYQMKKVCDALCAAGVDLNVVAGGDDANTRAEEQVQQRCPYPVQYFQLPASGVLRRLLGRFERRIGLLARRHSPFLLPAAECSNRIIDKWKPDVVMTVHTPIISHLVGMRVKRQHPDLPWVSFFSDPWPSGVLPVPYRTNRTVYWLERLYLRRILQQSDTIGVTSRFAVPYLEQAGRVRIADRACCLPHCGDEIMPPATAQPLNEVPAIDDCKRWLFHAGSLSGPRESRELLTAVRCVAEQYPREFRGLLVAGESADGRTMTLARELGADRYVRTLGNLSQESAMRLASQVTCNLVVEAKMQVSPFCPSKFADYAVAGNCILAITPPVGEVRALLAEHGGGWAVCDSAEKIGGAIKRIFVDGSWRVPVHCTLGDHFRHENVARTYHNMFLRTLATRGGAHQSSC